ncbi:hypothetical protein SAMN05444157_3166 [Frankineae bacterium MT45]|nr:hypothetical protein SAMN05444157_3166 [Frankineae bacterium MT45]
MSLQLDALCIDAREPRRLADFWGALLGWGSDDHRGGVAVLRPSDDTGFSIRLLPTIEPKVSQNLMHFDLTSRSDEGQQQTVARALELGAQPIDVGQRPEEGHVVLADPEGNEFCVIEAGNQFLADCGFIGAVACDGSQAVGYFWSAALEWPLVWDQDEETAIRSPAGGPKITWGGPPLMTRTGKNRLHFDVRPSPGDDPLAEVERLLALGATSIEARSESGGILLADPDGNEFRVVSPH